MAILRDLWSSTHELHNLTSFSQIVANLLQILTKMLKKTAFCIELQNCYVISLCISVLYALMGLVKGK